MRILLIIAALAIATASTSAEGSDVVPEDIVEQVNTVPVPPSTKPKQAPLLEELQESDEVTHEEKEQMFIEASAKMETLLQLTKKKGASLHCATQVRSSNNAGVIYAPSGGKVGRHQMYVTGGGMVNNYRSWNKLSTFEEAYPVGNSFRCDTGFGPGRLHCYSRSCATNYGGLSCVTKSLRFRGSGVRDVGLPKGYTMVGGGLYNHYRTFNARAGFEETRPNGNAWRGDMGFGWGDYTVYVRGCKKAIKGHNLECVTRQSGKGNYHHAKCPGGYQVTSCGINNHYRSWNHLSGYESHFPTSGSQCTCDSGFGTGSNTCYARCCKIKSPKPKATCVSNAKKSINAVIHEVKNAQSILNKMDNGSRCKNKGQASVKSAKISLARKQASEKAASKALSKAQNARISVSVTFSSGNRNCNVFTSSASWQKARRDVSRKKNALTKAKQQVKDAQNYLRKMEEKARKDRCKCKARVTKAASSAVAQARKLTGERKRSIIREHMVICLANARYKKTAKARNNAGQACKSQGLPSAYNSKLTLHQTKLAKMNFKCGPPAHRGPGTRINDKCGGWHLNKCFGGHIAFEALRNNNWSRYGNYQCPVGWKWATLAQYKSYIAQYKKGGCTYAYYAQCGWSGYNPRGPNNGGWNNHQHYMFRFKDSRSNCKYQHAGNSAGPVSSGCSTNGFGGIVCLKNK